MTDKEKIREEITKKLEVMQYQVHRKDAYKELKGVLAYIDSLQEEPASEPQVKESAKIQHVNDMCKENGKFLTHEPVSEELGDYINELSKRFPEVSFAKLSRIAVRVSRWQRNQDVKNKLPKVINRTDLDEYAYQCAYDMSNDWAIDNPTWHDVEDACKLGAKWQENHLWKSADGDDLSEYDREVIVLTQPYPLEGNEYAVSFAHRPNPDGWDGKSVTTGNVEHYTPKTYDKGGWNIPNVKYWLDCSMPKEIEL